MKTEPLNARVAPETKERLKAIQLHHAQKGAMRSYTEIVEELIERETKKLKLEI